jgi:hypothetical protein
MKLHIPAPTARDQMQMAPARERCLERKVSSALGEMIDLLDHPLPAPKAAVSGANGDMPWAIRSSLTNFRQSA